MANSAEKVKFIDLFCGIGGFRIAGERQGWECVFSSDIDPYAQITYEANFGHRPTGDITKVDERDIPSHDILFAGFPCQAFSICGMRKGFEDTRGTLFFEVARILKHHRPSAFVLENVPQLVTHDKGKTLIRILEILDNLGYEVQYKILNALDFGLPHNRRRVFIVGVNRSGGQFRIGNWPSKAAEIKSLSDVLESDDAVPASFFASDRIREKRLNTHASKHTPSIWHENKSGFVSSHPFSCALRASASYNYLLVDGVRRLTSRELLRLQGFPETYVIACNHAQTRKQAGNSVAVVVVAGVLREMLLPQIAYEIAEAA